MQFTAPPVPPNDASAHTKSRWKIPVFVCQGRPLFQSELHLRVQFETKHAAAAATVLRKVWVMEEIPQKFNIDTQNGYI